MNSAAEVVMRDLDDVVERAAKDLAMLGGRRVLITGGAGFLGYYLVQAMARWNASGERAIDVVVYDNFLRGTPAWLGELADAGRVCVVAHDVTRPLPADAGHFDYVIHAASIASPTYYRRHPIETMDANVGGLRHLLDYAVAEAAAGRPLAGFLFFSSSEIYGDPEPAAIPTPESYRGRVSCTGPRACYDESKRYGETLCVNFARERGVPAKAVRPFNNYGPGLKISDRRALPDFARNVLDGADIVLLSDGRPTRTFCYVTDAVVGYLAVLVRGGSGEAYNIGVDAPEISVRELAERVVATAARLFDYRGRVVLHESPDRDYLTDNPNRRCPDIGKARGALGYAPQVTLEEGLVRTLLWYRDNRSGGDA